MAVACEHEWHVAGWAAPSKESAAPMSNKRPLDWAACVATSNGNSTFRSPSNRESSSGADRMSATRALRKRVDSSAPAPHPATGA
eukprot:6482524-Amphidinium_carterae.1